jgi:hypothetical protein
MHSKTYTVTVSLRSMKNSNISVNELVYVLNDVFTQLNAGWSRAVVDYKAQIKRGIGASLFGRLIR